MNNKFYITTAIAYTSKKPHIGNTYEVILADALARYHRLIGDDVYFLTGTDEHGQKIEEYANQDGITPKEYVDQVAKQIKNIWDLMNCSYDQFIRTTDTKHEKTVQAIFKKLYEQGDIYKGEYSGLYCVPCESFFTESQLIDDCCPDCGREVKPTKEEAYFFKMSKYQDKLMEYIEKNPDFICPKCREREMVNNFLKPGLQDLCVSRTSFKWGIPVEFDPNHVVYVWIDALSNYITALGYDVDGNHGELYKKYWPAQIHLIGKDILRFHTIYWPIMLMALDEELPKQIFGHPWLLSGEDKMSKSKGNVIYADDLAKDFGVDGVRYYLLKEMPYAQDGTITYENIITKYNSDLANTIGNLVNRTIVMYHKYFDGQVLPSVCSDEEFDVDLIKTAGKCFYNYNNFMIDYKTCDAVEEIMELARRSNKYIDQTSPWILAKEEKDKKRLQTVLYNLLENIKYIGIMLLPIIPETAAKILNQIGVENPNYNDLKEYGSTITGFKLEKATPLFNRIDEKEFFAKVEKENPKQQEPKIDKTEVEGVLIGIEDFAKVELICGEILECEKIEKSDKLLKLKVNDGNKIRQVVSGIATYYSPQELINKKIILVSNLKPAKLRGELSEGMILACDLPEKKVVVIFLDENIKAGSKIR